MKQHQRPAQPILRKSEKDFYFFSNSYQTDKKATAKPEISAMITFLLLVLSLSLPSFTAQNLLAQNAPVAIPIEINGGNGAEPYNDDLNQWTGGWQAPQAIYDRGTYQDNPEHWSQDRRSEGSTWSNSDEYDGYGILVVDMQQLRTINHFRVFQMFSDGETTGIEIFMNSTYTGSTAPLSSDGGWASVTSGIIPIGPGQDNGDYISLPTAIPVTEFSSRYIKIHAYNDGSGAYGDGSYIEFKGIKAFYFNGSSYSINYMRGGPIPELTVYTYSTTNIGMTTATGNGEITDLGLSAVTAHGFCWNTDGTPIIDDSHSDEGSLSEPGEFSSSITGLSLGTEYYIRAYATNAEGTVYGDEEYFTTSAGEPVVSTQAATNISLTTATGNGTISDLGLSNVTAHGFCWREYYYGWPNIDDDSHTNEGSSLSTGTFTSSITGLTPGTWYNVRAYATNSQGTSYGTVVYFQTNDFTYPSVTTESVSNISYTTATGHGTITDLGIPNPTAHGVCWNTTGSPTIAGNHTDLGSASATGAFTTSITGLTNETTYYVRAYATNAKGTAYGETTSFTTLTYNPFNWYALGTGADADVFAVASSGDYVYAGGLFTTIGGNSIPRIARWDGSSWTGLGQGVDDGMVLAVAVDGNDVYIGGNFYNVSGSSINKIAKWDGSSWSSITTTPPNGTVSALAVVNGILYAAGDFSMIDGVNVNYIARWDGSSWSALSEGVNGIVYALATDGTNLYVGGSFVGINGINNGYRIARWDGSQWSGFGNGISHASVSAIAVMDGNVYAGGSFSDASGVPNTRNLAKWDGSSWNSICTFGNATSVRALAVSNGAVYAGGYFDAISGVQANNIAKYNGSTWSRIGSSSANGVNSTVNALSVSPALSSVIVGGSFSQTYGISNGAYISRFTDDDNNFSETIVWTGSTSSNWSTAANWSNNAVPAASDNVTIPAAPSNQPVVNEAPGTPAVCNDITIATGASVTIAPGKALTVNGTLANNAGNSGLLLQSDASGTASLLHNTAGVNATLQRYIPGSTELDDMVYHLVSVPLTPETNSTSNLFLGSYLYNFSENTNTWVIMGTPTTNILDETRGYMVYYPGANITYGFEGPMNHNSFTALTTFTPGKSPMAGNYGLNLVPNPYPSAIDWDAASGWTKTNLHNAVYVWNSAVSTSNYASYVNGASTNGGSRYIAPGQAFFVGANNLNPVLTMSYDVRLHHTVSFLKEHTIQNDLLLIHAEAGNKSDEAVIRFANGATNSFDGEWDAYKMTGGESAPQLGSLTEDGISLSINSLPLSGKPVSVPLTFSLNTDADARFSFSGLNTFTAYQAINLEDKLTGELIDLKQKSDYVFSHNTGNTAERFVLHFGSPAGIEDAENHNISSWFSGNTFYLSTPEYVGEKAKVEVFSISGQLLYSHELTLSNLQQFNLHAKGAVITRVTLNTKVLNTKAVVL